MGILDEAIREHLDLKRAHGAEESELKGLESEAFGPADRPDAISAPDPAVSPGSSITTPAGEGDQLDKVFKHETAESAVPSAETVEETKIIPAPDSEAEAETTISPVQLGSEAEAEDKPEVDTSPAPVQGLAAARPPPRSAPARRIRLPARPSDMSPSDWTIVESRLRGIRGYTARRS